MKRLLHVVSFTTDMATSRRFYRDAMGLGVGADTPFMVNFSTDGAGLMLLAVQPAQRREVELCFEAERVGAVVETLRGRGVEFIDELRHLAFGSVIHFRDPEGNLLSLLQPGSGAAPTAAERKAEAGARRRVGEDTGQLALALAESMPGARIGPALTTVMVRVQDMVAARGYFGRLLSLTETVISPLWVQYDTGDVQLTIHLGSGRDSGRFSTPPVSLGFSVEDLDEWIAAARSRSVEVVAVPASRGLGAAAEIRDPEGNLVVIREYVTESVLQRRLDAAGKTKPANLSTREGSGAGAGRKGAAKKPVIAAKLARRPPKRPEQPAAASKRIVAKSASPKRAAAKPAAPRPAAKRTKPRGGA